MGATRILIVDDHPLFREALKQAISGGVANASVSLAASLDAATAILGKEDDYDLILLDLRMPGVQGLSGLIYLRAQYPNVPVVIITAADDHGLSSSCMSPLLDSTARVQRSRRARPLRPADGTLRHHPPSLKIKPIYIVYFSPHL